MNHFARRVNRTLFVAHNSGARNTSTTGRARADVVAACREWDNQPDPNQIDVSLIDEYAYCDERTY
jgi:hypothetical protein